MMLGGNKMKPFASMQWTGVGVAAVGAVLMGYSAPLSRSLMGAPLSAALSVPLDWLLLIGMAAVISGGLLVQVTWRNQHE